MKNIFKIISVLSVLLFMLTTSCTEKENTWIADLEHGAYLVLDVVPDAVQGVTAVSEVTFVATLRDPAGTVADYTLSIVGTIGGVQTAEFVVGTYTTFPLSFDWGINELAAAVGLTAADISFGDAFNFSGTVTHINGTVYGAETPTYDDGVLDLAGGTNDEVVDPTNGYRNGFAFGFVIGCPADTYNSASIPGNWNAFSATWPADGTVVFTIDAADPNVMLVDGMAALDGMVDTPEPMRLTVDPADNSVLCDPDVILAVNFYGFDNMFLTGNGTIFPCAGNTILINLQYRVVQGSFGTYGYVFTPL